MCCLDDVGEEPNSYSTRLGPLSSRIPLVSRRATASEDEEEDEEDEEDAMENQMKFRRSKHSQMIHCPTFLRCFFLLSWRGSAVIGTMPGGLSSLLEDYEDSVVLQTSLDPTERLNQQTSAANRSTNNRSSFLVRLFRISNCFLTLSLCGAVSASVSTHSGGAGGVPGSYSLSGAPSSDVPGPGC